MQRRPHFNAFYQSNPSKINISELFPEFYENGQPLYTKIKAGVLSGDKHAIEVFRLLFKPAMKLNVGGKPLTETTYFKKIREEFGSQLVCTGVEEQKGGQTSLLLMCVTGYIRSSNFSWGSLGDYGSMPNTDPGAHGPYYIVYSVDARTGKDKFPTNPKLKVIDKILVPFIENVRLITAEIDKLLQLQMITSEEATCFKSKLIDYKGFYEQLVKFKETPDDLVKFQETTKSTTPTKPTKVSRFREGVTSAPRNLASEWGDSEITASTTLGNASTTLFEDASDDNPKPAKRLAPSSPSAPSISELLAPPKP